MCISTFLGLLKISRDNQDSLIVRVKRDARFGFHAPSYNGIVIFQGLMMNIDILTEQGVNIAWINRRSDLFGTTDVRVRINAVAYLPAELLKRKRGRPKLYGNKIKLRDILADTKKMIHATSTLYDEVESKFLYRSLDLIEIIKIYSLRFKIEVSFKQAMRILGAYSYHFWMMNMDRIKKCSGDQYLHRKTEKYREQVKRKLHAYHAHVQIGLIAQGVLQVLSMTAHQFVWKYFGSWIRTIRPNILPSETIVMGALRNTLPEFLKDSSADLTIAKFILDKIDLSRAEGQRMVA